jgi:hypothetical protein
LKKIHREIAKINNSVHRHKPQNELG